ncbi:MAG: AtpZ/AtpI family protein [Chloroflexi bacterium]|nr:AtpZ/AtpI family protein [Chloroflexota bacterium]
MRQWPPAMQLMGIGWYVATCIVFGVVGGVLLDDELGTGFALTLIGLALGLASAGWGGYRMLQDMFAAQAKQRQDEQRRESPDEAPADDEQDEEDRA